MIPEGSNSKNISTGSAGVICPADQLAGSSIKGQNLCRGFTLIELVIVIVIIAILMGLFMNRFVYYQEQAEKIAMEEVVGVIQSSLTMQYGQITTRGKSSDVTALVKDNPINLLQKRPSNYAGEFYEASLQSAPPGNWLFDLKTQELIYLPRNTDNFRLGADGKPWVRFHTVAAFEPSRLPSQQNSPPELTGLLFEAVEPYSWF